MNNVARRFVEDQSGASAVEYAIILAGMAAIALAIASVVSDGLSQWAENLAALMGAS